jgi:cytochrome c peroxidase
MLLLAAALLAWGANTAQAHGGDDHGLRDTVELSLESLGPLPADPSNRWADDRGAAALGHRLFFDARLSANGQVSCATCHDPRRDFQDGVALGKGTGTTNRRTMPIAATAYSPFLFWDGRKDSQWSQALGPLESPVEHGGTRAQYAKVVAAHYRKDYERLFGELPDLRQKDAVTAVFVNIGKAIAAYERQVRFGPSRFDRFAAEWKRTGTKPADILDAKERAGLALFQGKAHCTQCHNGPLLTNNEFHNTGVPAARALPEDRGRAAAVAAVQADEFNCRSRWSDAKPGQCAELDFLAPAAAPQQGAFKVPSLRNVAERAPYMHAGQLASLREVLDHYNRAPAAPVGHSELEPLGLDATELDQLEAFLRTLSGGLVAPPGFLAEPGRGTVKTLR